MFVSSSLNGITQLSNDIVMMLFLGLVTLVCVFIGAWFIAANVNKPDREMLGKLKVSSAAWTVSGIGLAVRIALSLVTVGFLGINANTAFLSSDGLLEVYYFVQRVLGGVKPDGLYPVPGYLALVMGGFLNLVGGFNVNGNLFMQLFIRLPYMLCDAAAVIVLFKITKKYAGGYVGLGLAALYALCPIFFFSSSMWGSVLSVLSLLILLALYYMTQKNFLGLTIAYGLALLTAKEALYFLPIFGVFYVYHFIKSLRLNREGTAANPVGKKAAAKVATAKESYEMSFKEKFKDKERGLIFRIPLYVIVSLFAMYFISMPMLSGIKYDFFTWFSTVYIRPLTKISFFSTNAFSIYNLFGRNNMAVAGTAGGWVVSLIGMGFLLIATALTYVLYSSKKNRANMVVIACYVFVTLSVYSMGFSELSLLPVLGALLFAFALVKDKRILHIFGLLAIVMIVNGCAVMISAGFFTNAPISDFASGTGSAFLSKSTFGTTFNIVCTIIAVLTHLYFTLIVLDLSISNKRVLFAPQNDSFGESLKNWFKFK